MPRRTNKIKSIAHDGESRPNNPSAEFEGLVRAKDAQPVKVNFKRKFDPDTQPDLYKRTLDADLQLVWKGKEAEDRLPLTADAAPIFVQERVLPKALIEDLLHSSQLQGDGNGSSSAFLFESWARELSDEARVDFYAHSQKWANRFILGDSLLVMTSLAEKEQLRGGVQCFYCDPPYGIDFRSNWQPTTKRKSLSEDMASLSREPEVVQAFRDTWRNGLNSYLSYMRDRMMVARELLAERGSFFLQIGEDNVHLLRSMLDEVFGRENFVSQIAYKKKQSALGAKGLPSVCEYLLWYAKKREAVKMYKLYLPKTFGEDTAYTWVRNTKHFDRKMTVEELAHPERQDKELRPFCSEVLISTGYTKSCYYDIAVNGKIYHPQRKSWRTNADGMRRLIRADRIVSRGRSPYYRRYFHDFAVQTIDNFWQEPSVALNPIYTVQSGTNIVEKCILMTTDPGDLVFDPTCGSGTTAFVAEKWGRRWISTDTSRVALALARARIMGAQYDYYHLQDSKEGSLLESQLAGKPYAEAEKTYSENVQHGFVYDRCPYISLGMIAQNKTIDSIWERWEGELSPLLNQLNSAVGEKYEEWSVPCTAPASWPQPAQDIHAEWLQKRKCKQDEIDEAIMRNADTELLRNKPMVQANVIRVAGPFTVESLSPHRVLPTNADDDPATGPDAGLSDKDSDSAATRSGGRLRPMSVENGESKFLDIVFEALQKAGVQNTIKNQRMEFLSLEPWSRSRCIQFEGRYEEKGRAKKVAICVGPEYGTVTRSLMVQAARESADYFDMLVVLGFAFEAHADEELLNIGKMPVLRARMNSDLHMADRLKAVKSSNLFVVFGEPDIKLRKRDDGNLEVEFLGIDIFDPTTGEVKSSDLKDIACWFIDTDYNEEAFFVRHAYFTGGGPDPYKKLKAALKAEINAEAWEQLYSTISRPFPPPSSGRIAVKAINDFGDEVLKVFSVPK